MARRLLSKGVTASEGSQPSGPRELPTHDPGTGHAPLPRRRAEFPLLSPVRLLGVGAYAPERRLTNAELEQRVDTSDEWIRTRTGIQERRIVAEGEATSDMAIAAARGALARAELAPEDLDLVLLATATPDCPTPPTVCRVTYELGAPRAAGFDLNAACSGFVTALMTGHRMVASGAYENALVIGADALSTITDYQSRESCILFGDGAGAVVLGAGAGRGQLLDHEVGHDGAGGDLIRVPAGGSRRPASHETVEERAHYLHIQGRAVFRFAVAKVCELVSTLLARNGLSIDELGLLVPHQANGRIIDAAARALGLPAERVVVNIERYGNTSNASIPLALAEAAEDGRMRPGDPVLLVAFGGGLTWGASLLRW